MIATREELKDVGCWFASDSVGGPEMTACKREARRRPLDRDAEAGSNFLTPAIYEVAQARIEQAQDHETLDVARLRRDLFSSMLMAFNLFGEASLLENEVSRHSLSHRRSRSETLAARGHEDPPKRESPIRAARCALQVVPSLLYTMSDLMEERPGLWTLGEQGAKRAGSVEMLAA